MIRGYFYRFIMKLAHRYNWHYAPPAYPEGDTLLWCQWCGFRETTKRNIGGIKLVTDPAMPEASWRLTK